MTANATIDRAAVDALADFRLDRGLKGMPIAAPRTIAELRAAGLHALDGGSSLPVMVLRRRELMDNISAMSDYCRDRGILFAPHAKTSMAPQLLAAQIDAGCWALTAATPYHLTVYRRFGISRIFQANQLVERAAIEWVAAELDRDAGFDFYCLVDSVRGVELMADALGDRTGRRRINVLVEVGHAGGRGGCRSLEELLDVAAAVGRTSSLELVGVECFEGLIRRSSLDETFELVDDLLQRCHEAVDALLARNAFEDRPILSAGGSAWFDRVLASFSPRADARTVLRSGCYVTQDGGFYDQMSPLAGRADGPPRLHNALEVWGVVQSRPEPGLIIASFGKRDVPMDLGMPVPLKTFRAGAGVLPPPEGGEVVALSDHHAHVSVDPAAGTAVGDLLGVAISHPCTAFDKWRVIPVVDDDYRIVDAVVTFF
jgi:D-serine deaminase-like pyridoxal phosphate-dependent protein